MAVKALDQVVELVPVILLNVDGDDLPARPDGRDAGEWAGWRRDCWSALNVGPEDLPDGMHVALHALTSNRLLDAVIDYVHECAGDTGEFAPYVDGGAVLKVDDRIVAAPGCCVDLRDGVDCWAELVTKPPTSWEMVWVGHPWILARCVGDVLEFSEQSDGPRPEAVAEVARSLLAGAVQDLMLERARFADRLGARLADRGHHNARATALTVSGLAR